MFRRTLGAFLLVLCIGAALPAAARPSDPPDSIFVRFGRIVKRLLPAILDASEISFPKP
jgi:hypothetical protein